jgi:hypothetical protein
MRKLCFTNPVVLLIVFTLHCSGCVSAKDCTFTPQLTSASAAIPEGFGVNIDFTDPQPGEINMLSAAGFRWVRMDLVWEATEKEPGRYDFSAYDRLMTSLEPFGIHALFILDYANHHYDNGAPPRTEVTRQAFARWAVAAGKHFAGRGTLWEIYNEPNQLGFWRPQPNAHEYAALALEVGRAFRAAVPAEKLIGPATSEIDFAFIETCFKAGLLEYWSAVSIHPYRRNDPETAAQDYCRLRELIKRYTPVAGQSPVSNVQRPVNIRSSNEQTDAQREITIISSEWGYSSVWPGMSDEKQGQLLARSWLTNVANNVSLSIWYDWRDDGTDSREAEHHFGTVANSYHDDRDPVYDPKPAYLAARTLATFFNGYRFQKRLNTGSEDDYVLVFQKGADLRYAAWTTAKSPHSILIPLAAGRYSTTSYTGEENTVNADQRGLTINLTTAPIYVR